MDGQSPYESEPMGIQQAWSGVYCALLTAMDEDAEVDTEMMAAHVQRLVDLDVDGVVALGTTGEFSDLTPDERDIVIETVVRTVNGRVPVIAGVGALSTAESCAAAERAAAAGADCVLALPPLYWGTTNADLLFRHFIAVADAASAPVVVYDYPAGGRSPLHPGLICDLAAKHPGIVGVKQTVTDVSLVEHMAATVAARGAELVLGVGYEHLALSSHLLGGRLLISGLANFCTPLLKRLMSALAGGDGTSALAYHAQVLRLSAIYRLSSPPISAIKRAAQVAGMSIGPTSRTSGVDDRKLQDEVEALLSTVRPNQYLPDITRAARPTSTTTQRKG